jgi:hypothetical protein
MSKAPEDDKDETPTAITVQEYRRREWYDEYEEPERLSESAINVVSEHTVQWEDSEDESRELTTLHEECTDDPRDEPWIQIPSEYAVDRDDVR